MGGSFPLYSTYSTVPDQDLKPLPSQYTPDPDLRSPSSPEHNPPHKQQQTSLTFVPCFPHKHTITITLPPALTKNSFSERNTSTEWLPQRRPPIPPPSLPTGRGTLASRTMPSTASGSRTAAALNREPFPDLRQSCRVCPGDLELIVLTVVSPARSPAPSL